MQALQRGQAFSLAPQTFQDLVTMAKAVANSSFCPRAYQGKHEDIMIAMQMGAELQLAPMQAIQNISVINGRPCVWGDALLGIVKGHPQFEDIEETLDEAGTATCVVKRRGQVPTTATFSIEDAKRARLWGKAGPWQQYPQRMLQLRARGFACRDAFPDALKGIMPAEEVRDYQEPVAAAVVAKPKEKTHPMMTLIAAAPTVEYLDALVPELETLSDDDKAVVRPIYRARRKALLGIQDPPTTKDPEQQLMDLLRSDTNGR